MKKIIPFILILMFLPSCDWLKGDDGDKGETGIAGLVGPSGFDGTNGSDGSDGSDGKDWAMLGWSQHPSEEELLSYAKESDQNKFKKYLDNLPPVNWPIGVREIESPTVFYGEAYSDLKIIMSHDGSYKPLVNQSYYLTAKVTYVDEDNEHIYTRVLSLLKRN